ncbi:hypothetical protein HDU97_005448 [Phlyctochytrium planicorne]|nr:hypothetical protein HDU97_005448 [Phlyctochytrium planicorne]
MPQSDLKLSCFASNYVNRLLSDGDRSEKVVSSLKLGEPHIEESFGAVAMIDISGYSKLTSSLASRGKISSELITIAVRNYMNKIVDVVVSYGGDVIRFLGDAILVVFSPSSLDESHQAIVTAIKCTINILTKYPFEIVDVASLTRVITTTNETKASEFFSKKLRNIESDSPQMRLHIAITAGTIQHVIIGAPESRMDYIVYGNCFHNLADILSCAGTDEIAISSEAWHSACQLVDVDPVNYPPTSGDSILLSSNSFPTVLKLFNATDEKAISFSCPSNIKHLELLEKFMNASVAFNIKSTIRHDESDAFSQYRSVSVIFVKLLSDFVPSVAQRAMVLFVEALKRNEGVFQQYSVDDKGQTMLACFGLPPWTHTNDAVRAIRTAITFSQKFNLCPIAVSVTSGTLLFTRLGTAVRGEASLLGDIVNQAARLLTIADSKHNLVCDSMTASSITSSAKQLLGLYQLKGIDQKVEVWKVDTSQSIPESQRTIAKNVGYAVEKKSMLEMLTEWKTRRTFTSLLVEGTSGIGKSSLMEWFLSEARRDSQTICISRISKEKKNVPFSGIQTTLFTLLRSFIPRADLRRISIAVSRNSASSFGSLHHIKDAASSISEETLHNCFMRLNENPRTIPLLNVFFPWLTENDYTKHLAPEARNSILFGVLARLVCGWSSSGMMMVFDDIQWMDSCSLSIITQVIKSDPKVSHLNRPISQSENADLFRMSELLKGQRFQLGGLSKDNISELLISNFSEQGATTVVSELSTVLFEKASQSPMNLQVLVETLKARDLLSIREGVIEINVGVGKIAQQVDEICMNAVIIQFDRLLPEFQEFLRHASVFGQYFTLEDVMGIMGGDRTETDLEKMISEMDTFNFIRQEEEDSTSHLLYFRHISILNAISESISYSQKSSWHGIIGARLEQAMIETDMKTLLPLVYYHFSRSSDTTKRIQYGEAFG